MIYLRTGLPGSGKTLRTIWEGMQAAEGGREVYALNVNGLDHEATGIQPAPIDDLSQWESMPAGCVLIVDECQRYLPPMGSGARVPDWVEALTRNRHHGIDLHLITQHPRLINYYVRELVNYHEHLVRLEGNMQRARVYYSEGLMPLSGGVAPKDASFKLWKYPADVFGAYKSAEVHTISRYTPQRLKLALAGAVVLVVSLGLAWAVMSRVGRSSAPAEPARVVEHVELPAPAIDLDTVGLSRGVDRSGEPASWTTAAEYADLHRPLIDGMPWTARAYAHRPVTADPRIFCMSTVDTCRCVSEQGTTIVTADAVCRSIARHGVYNPYKQASTHAGVVAGQQSGALSIGQR